MVGVTQTQLWIGEFQLYLSEQKLPKYSKAYLDILQLHINKNAELRNSRIEWKIDILSEI